MVERRVFVSATSDAALDSRRKQLKVALLQELLRHKLQPQMFFEAGIAENLPWSFDNVESVMRRCVGAVVLGFPRWSSAAGARLVGEYNHYEGAVALTCKLPVLILAERGVESRGIVWTGGGRTLTFVPEDAGPEWIAGTDFQRRFEGWRRELENRRDVFLGYCSQNAGVAAQIETRLNRQDATVLNYQMDFRYGMSILDEIKTASAQCSCGIFLFGKNDPLEGDNGGAAPRDNVVFEAGYFMSSKGADKCLIIREDDAKMPADLGGAIYVPLKGSDVNAIEGRLTAFLSKNL